MLRCVGSVGRRGALMSRARWNAPILSFCRELNADSATIFKVRIVCACHDTTILFGSVPSSCVCLTPMLHMQDVKEGTPVLEAYEDLAKQGKLSHDPHQALQHHV